MAVVTQNGTTTSKPVAQSRPKQSDERYDLGPLELDQELELFCHWKGKPTWVPPQGTSTELAKSMLNQFGAFADKEDCWKGVAKAHREEFTQVREIELPKASIRLPQGRLFVTVTQQKDFDKIEDQIPNCVRTRLEEFLEGPGREPGVRVFYLKPLCVEVGNKLVFTTKEEIDAATGQIQEEVFSEYRRLYLRDRLRRTIVGLGDAALAIPRSLIRSVLNRKKREIEHYHRQMEFQRKKLTMDAVGKWQEFRTQRCTYQELLALSHTPSRERCIQQLCDQENKSALDRQLFIAVSAATLPWFVALSLSAVKIATAIVTGTTTVAVFDPVFVAEMPGKRGQLLKIGHFDEVDGVMHVEI